MKPTELPEGIARIQEDFGIYLPEDMLAAIREQAVAEERERLRAVWTRAMSDPGAFVEREIDPEPELDYESGLEPLIDWQLRALFAALDATKGADREETTNG